MGGFSPSFLDSNGGLTDAPSPPSFAFSPTAFFPSLDQPTSPSSFQLLASNPSYTSFRDPQSSLDAQMDFFTHPSLSPSSNELFGGQAQFDATQFDDFFQNQMMPTFTTPAVESNNPLSPTSSVLASLLNDSPPNNDSPTNDFYNSQDGSPSSTVSSEAPPISYSPEEVKVMLEHNLSPAEYEEKKRTGLYSCPKSHSKEDIDVMIKGNAPATFGPPVASGSGSPESSSLEAGSSKYAMLSGPSASAAMAAEAKRLSVPWDPENHQKFFEGKIFLAAVRIISLPSQSPRELDGGRRSVEGEKVERNSSLTLHLPSFPRPTSCSAGPEG